MKKYRVTITVYEQVEEEEYEDELVASFGGTAQGENLADALPQIEMVIGNQYQQVRRMASIADSDEARRRQDDPDGGPEKAV